MSHKFLEFGQLLYWINERELIRKAKEAGAGRPWSHDKVMQETYFCNVRRNDDKVTKFILDYYRDWATHLAIEYNTIFARCVNLPSTILKVGYMRNHNELLTEKLLSAARSDYGKVFNGAYIFSTNGISMDKCEYLSRVVLRGAAAALGVPGVSPVEPRGALFAACRGGSSPPTLAGCHGALMQLHGLGSFMAAQVVADLKYLPGHPLNNAVDFMSWAAPGPGSLRGMKWLVGDFKPSQFLPILTDLRWKVDESKVLNEPISAQDLQNCLCEFDKFMRVKNGVGRSKRKYQGV